MASPAVTAARMANPSNNGAQQQAPKKKKVKKLTKKTRKRLEKHHDKRIKAANKMNKKLDAFDDWFDNINGTASCTESETSDLSGSDEEEIIEEELVGSSDEEDNVGRTRAPPCRGQLKARKSGELESLFAAVSKPKKQEQTSITSTPSTIKKKAKAAGLAAVMSSNMMMKKKGNASATAAKNNPLVTPSSSKKAGVSLKASGLAVAMSNSLMKGTPKAGPKAPLSAATAKKVSVSLKAAGLATSAASSMMLTSEQRRRAQALQDQRKSSKRNVMERKSSIQTLLGKHLDDSSIHSTTDSVTAATVNSSMSSGLTDDSSLSSPAQPQHKTTAAPANRRNRLVKDTSNSKLIMTALYGKGATNGEMLVPSKATRRGSIETSQPTRSSSIEKLNSNRPGPVGGRSTRMMGLGPRTDSNISLDSSIHSTTSSASNQNLTPGHLYKRNRSKSTTSATALSMIAARSPGSLQPRRRINRRGSMGSEYSTGGDEDSDIASVTSCSNHNRTTTSSSSVPMTPRRSGAGGGVAAWQKRLDMQNKPPPASPGALKGKAGRATSSRGLRDEPESPVPPAFQSISSPRGSTRTGRRSIDKESGGSRTRSTSPGRRRAAGCSRTRSTSPSSRRAAGGARTRSTSPSSRRAERRRSRSPGSRRAERAARRGSIQSSNHDNHDAAPKVETGKITMTPKTPSGVKKWQRRVSDADVASVPTLFQAAVAASPRTSGGTGGGSVRSTRRSLDAPPKKSVSTSDAGGLPPAFQSITSPTKGSRGSVRTTRRSIDRDSQRDRRRSRSTSVSGMRERKEMIRSSRASSTKALESKVNDDKEDLENGISDLNFAASSPKASKAKDSDNRREDDKENDLENATSNLNYAESPVRPSKANVTKDEKNKEEEGGDLENGISDLNFMPLKGEEEEEKGEKKERSTRSERTTRRSIDRAGPREQRRRARSTSVSGMRERKERLRASYEQTKRTKSAGNNANNVGGESSNNNAENAENAPPTTPRRLSTWEKREALKRQSWDQRSKIAHSMNAAMGDKETEIPLPPAFRQFGKRK